MAKTVNIYEAKTNLSKLVEEAAAGRHVVIARAGRPVARLTRLHPTAKRRLGLLDGEFRIPANFNDPLPVDVEKSFGGE